MLFNYDWWFGTGFSGQIAEAKGRCAAARFPKLKPAEREKNSEYTAFLSELEARSVVYLRDGFSYEIKELVERKDTIYLMFECTPAEDAYRVGCFVVTTPFEDVVRVEVFAVHTSEKPEDMPMIKGFGGVQPPAPPGKRGEDRPVRRERETTSEPAPAPSGATES